MINSIKTPHIFTVMQNNKMQNEKKNTQSVMSLTSVLQNILTTLFHYMLRDERRAYARRREKILYKWKNGKMEFLKEKIDMEPSHVSEDEGV